MVVFLFEPCVVLTVIWFVLALLQGIDLAATWGASRTSGRAAAQVWSAAAAAVVLVAGTVAAEVAAHPLIDGTDPTLGLVSLLPVLVLVCASLIAIVLVYQRPWVDALTAVETEIHAFDGLRVEKADVAVLKQRLADADLARLDHTHPRAWWRWIPAVVGLAVFISTVVVISVAGAWPSLGVLAIVAIVPIALSVLARFAEVLLRLAVRARRETAYSARRQALVADLDQLERRASRGVAGLTERVSRALTILRDQPSLREQDRRK